MDIDTQTELETKAGLPQDAVVTHAEMMRAFEEFKEANDQRIADKAHSRRRPPDEKLARLDSLISTQGRRLDEIALKNARHRRSGADTHGQRSNIRQPLRLTCVRVRAQICVHSNQRRSSVG